MDIGNAEKYREALDTSYQHLKTASLK